jgi:murein DD-endopeptidase MepM/ murein hydrolase activator NlpD
MTVVVPAAWKSTVAHIDELSAQWRIATGTPMTGPNAFARPETLAQLLDEYHVRNGVNFSHGVYGENRTRVWRGTYLDEFPGGCIHLGEDINVPVGTEVQADAACEVVWKGDDTPDMHGWGNRLIVKLRGLQIWIIYAHLSQVIRCNVGDILTPGYVFGTVGDIDENGYWHPHLHVQAMTVEGWSLFTTDKKLVDGYCAVGQWPILRRVYPDPSQYVRIP